MRKKPTKTLEVKFGDGGEPPAPITVMRKRIRRAKDVLEQLEEADSVEAMEQLWEELHDVVEQARAHHGFDRLAKRRE